MDAERIERLAIDRALGELNEDAVVLLDTYLAEHPEAQPWARSMADTCARTREAIDKKTHNTDAGNSVGGYRQPARIHWARLGRWAALIAISLGIGAAVGRWSRPRFPVRDEKVAQAQSPVPAPEGWRQLLASPGQGFWQRKALAMMESKPHEPAHSPRTQTGLWDRYRQFRREPSYD